MNLITTDKKYTVGGREARVLCVDVKHEWYPVAAIVQNPDGSEYTGAFTKEGHKIRGGPNEQRDLIEVKEKKRLFINVYAQNGRIHGAGYDSRAEADRYAGPARFACKQIEVEGGEGL